MNVIPEDYDDDDFQHVAYQAPFHANPSSASSIPDTIYEDKSKIQLAGLRQTSLAQIEGKKRYRPPTMISSTPSAGALLQQQQQYAQVRNTRSPSAQSFMTSSSGGDRSSTYTPLHPSQQQHPHHMLPQQQYMPHPQHQYNNRPLHPQHLAQGQQIYQQHAQQQHAQQQQNQQFYQQNHPNFQPPVHYQHPQQLQRSTGSLLSPASSSFHLTQPPKRHPNLSSDSLTPSTSFEQAKNELPITPESMEGEESSDQLIISDLNEKTLKLLKENEELNEKLDALTKQLSDKELELQLKNNIIDAKTKQLALREEKLNNKDKQIELLNKKVRNPEGEDEEVAKLLELNRDLIKQMDEMKLEESSSKRYSKVNKDLSLKVVLLLEEIEVLKSAKLSSSPAISNLSPRIPLSTRINFDANSVINGGNGNSINNKTSTSNKTIKDFTKEELFQSEFLKILETLNQNQFYYENKIKILKETVEEHKKLIFNISHTRKGSSSTNEVRKGFKVIDIVPPKVI